MDTAATAEVDHQRLVIQCNNEGVHMIQRGEFIEAKKLLMDALRDFRSSTTTETQPNANAQQPTNADVTAGDSTNDGGSSFESLCLDQWMVSSTEALHTRLSESSTSSFFVYPKGILIPINFFQDNANRRYCHIDVTAAITSVVCFNQALACQLAHIRAPAESRDVQSLQKASELYRLSIQGTRQRQRRMSTSSSGDDNDNSSNNKITTNANFLIAAMNNLAVSERIYDISTSTATTSTTNGSAAANANANATSNASNNNNPQVNYQNFETLRSFLLNCRPTTSNTPEEVLWIAYLENVLRGSDLEQSNYSVIPL
ncbi:MAG: hypothetical protein SGBAC_008105 [Bacillariaceae sp.]